MLEFKQIFTAVMGIIMSNVSADIFFLSYETITKQSLRRIDNVYIYSIETWLFFLMQVINYKYVFSPVTVLYLISEPSLFVNIRAKH